MWPSLSAANIFIVRDGNLITPDTNTDILEGINRKTIVELAREHNIPVAERAIDLTELYIADEVFVCGTSAFLSPVITIDARHLPEPKQKGITYKLMNLYEHELVSTDSKSLTKI